MAHIQKFSREDNEQAIAHFRRAFELDPNFAAAYGMAARSFAQRRAGRWLRDPEREVAEAVGLARQAIALDRHDAVALCTAGFTLADVGDDLEDGDALIEQAIALNPNLTMAWYLSGWVKISRGEPEVAIERLSHAIRLSPHDPYIFGMQSAMASAHFSAGRHAEASSWAEMSMRIKPDYLLPACIAAASAGMAGRVEESKKALAKLRQVDPELRLSNLKSVIAYLRPEDFAKWVEGLRKAGLPE